MFSQTISSDQWSLTDALGRKALSSEIQTQKSKKTVAMFYWTWHQGNDDINYKVKNTSKILKKNPKAIHNYNDPDWGHIKPGYFYWEEPLFGYYKTTDPWVLRKHAEMLADAGVDVVFFDCTNGTRTWQDSYEVLLETWDQAQRDGVNVPKIAFFLPFKANEQSMTILKKVYTNLYKKNRYKNLWFYWDNKPCIMAYPDNLKKNGIEKEIFDFFTFRPAQPDYVDGPKRNDQWGWLEVYPQNGYIKLKNGKFEQVPVGVAQNASFETKGKANAFNLPNTFGRNFSKLKGFDKRKDSYLFGWNFQEQWDRALDLNPELVFVTGWNEFIAGQWVSGTNNNWKGKGFSFVDQFDWNRSRDIEPIKGWGSNGDVYYTQLVLNTRKYKGVEKSQPVSSKKTIRLGHISSWDNVYPHYKHYKGNTFPRNHRGRYSEYYKNNTGRNDIVSAKVARDDEYLYFYVSTNSALTSPTGKNWMLLFLDIDRNKKTGWNGYDYIINRINPKNNLATLEKSNSNSWKWTKISSNIQLKITNNILEIQIPKKLLQISGENLNFEFKWNDNMQEVGNILDFYSNGDTAPGGRFNFVYDTNK